MTYPHCKATSDIAASNRIVPNIYLRYDTLPTNIATLSGRAEFLVFSVGLCLHIR